MRRVLKAGHAQRWTAGVAAAVAIAAPAYGQIASRDADTSTPIKHVIVIIGENRSFDHVFATYKPKTGQTIWNLLSRGIVNEDGSPGPNYSWSAQSSALDNTSAAAGLYTVNPVDKRVYVTLPPPMTGGAHEAPSDTAPAPFKTMKVAQMADRGLLQPYEEYLLTGATGLPVHSVDTRIPNVNAIPGGVFPLRGGTLKYDAYTADPVHRFFQMWQQTDCSAALATKEDPSGCQDDLFSWVETTVGIGDNGKPQPKGFTDRTTGEGSASMGFYSMAQGDAPYLKLLADLYSIDDNFHQAVMGGSTPNHILLAYGDAIWYSNGHGVAEPAPLTQVEDPNPQPGANNYYDKDGYAGGPFVDCSDLSQPGVAAVVNYLESLDHPIDPHCEPGHYYLVNDYYPYYAGDGTSGIRYWKTTVPPVSQRHIGDVLNAAGVSWKFYAEGWDLYLRDLAQKSPYESYRTFTNPFQYSSTTMANAAQRTAHLADTAEFYQSIELDRLPAVAFVKPGSFNDGHPGSSKLDLFEGFVRKIVEAVQQDPKLWATTAIFITEDEGGGYYDSGYIQPLDFFGDGTRIPLIVVSPYARKGVVSHEYGDLVSIDKFIEANWDLKPISARSRDNLPDPKTNPDNPYVPINTPAIGDLMSLFQFPATTAR